MIAGTQSTDSNAASKLQHGKDIALAGVSIQLAAFGLFSFVAVRFHFISKRFTAGLERRFQTSPGGKFVTLEGSAWTFKPKWRHLLYVVNASCIFILVKAPVPRRHCGEYTQASFPADSESRSDRYTEKLISPSAKEEKPQNMNTCKSRHSLYAVPELRDYSTYIFDALPMSLLVLSYTFISAVDYVPMGWRQPKDDEVRLRSADTSDPEAYGMRPVGYAQ
jgi:hypothetical protein